MTSSPTTSSPSVQDCRQFRTLCPHIPLEEKRPSGWFQRGLHYSAFLLRTSAFFFSLSIFRLACSIFSSRKMTINRSTEASQFSTPQRVFSFRPLQWAHRSMARARLCPQSVGQAWPNPTKRKTRTVTGAFLLSLHKNSHSNSGMHLAPVYCTQCTNRQITDCGPSGCFPLDRESA